MSSTRSPSLNYPTWAPIHCIVPSLIMVLSSGDHPDRTDHSAATGLSPVFNHNHSPLFAPTCSLCNVVSALVTLRVQSVKSISSDACPWCTYNAVEELHIGCGSYTSGNTPKGVC